MGRSGWGKLGFLWENNVMNCDMMSPLFIPHVPDHFYCWQSDITSQLCVLNLHNAVPPRDLSALFPFGWMCGWKRIQLCSDIPTPNAIWTNRVSVKWPGLFCKRYPFKMKASRPVLALNLKETNIKKIEKCIWATKNARNPLEDSSTWSSRDLLFHKRGES